jgi:hypothetical protein
MRAAIFASFARQVPGISWQVDFAPIHVENLASPLAAQKQKLDALAIGAKAATSGQDARELVIG